MKCKLHINVETLLGDETTINKRRFIKTITLDNIRSAKDIERSIRKELEKDLADKKQVIGNIINISNIAFSEETEDKKNKSEVDEINDKIAQFAENVYDAYMNNNLFEQQNIHKLDLSINLTKDFRKNLSDDNITRFKIEDNAIIHTNIFDFNSYLSIKDIVNTMSKDVSDSSLTRQFAHETMTRINNIMDRYNNIVNTLHNYDIDRDSAKIRDEIDEIVIEVSKLLENAINELKNVNKNVSLSVLFKKVLAMQTLQLLSTMNTPSEAKASFHMRKLKEITRNGEVVPSFESINIIDRYGNVVPLSTYITSNIYEDVIDTVKGLIEDKDDIEKINNETVFSFFIDKYKSNIKDMFKVYVKTTIAPLVGSTHEDTLDKLVKSKQDSKIISVFFGLMNSYNDPELLGVISHILAKKTYNTVANKKHEELIKFKGIDNKVFEAFYDAFIDNSDTFRNIFLSHKKADTSSLMFYKHRASLRQSSWGSVISRIKKEIKKSKEPIHTITLDDIFYDSNGNLRFTAEELITNVLHDAIKSGKIFVELGDPNNPNDVRFNIRVGNTYVTILDLSKKKQSNIDLNNKSAELYAHMISNMLAEYKYNLDDIVDDIREENKQDSEEDIATLLFSKAYSPFSLLISKSKIEDTNTLFEDNEGAIDIAKQIINLNKLTGNLLFSMPMPQTKTFKKKLKSTFNPFISVDDIFHGGIRSVDAVVMSTAESVSKLLNSIIKNKNKKSSLKVIRATLKHYGLNQEAIERVIYGIGDNIKVDKVSLYYELLKNKMQNEVKRGNFKNVFLSSIENTYDNEANNMLRVELQSLKYIVDMFIDDDDKTLSEAYKKQKDLLEDWEIQVLDNVSPYILKHFKDKYGIDTDPSNKKEFLQELYKKISEKHSYISPVNVFLDKIMGYVSKKYMLLNALKSRLKEMIQDYEGEVSDKNISSVYKSLVNKPNRTKEEDEIVNLIEALIKYESHLTAYGVFRVMSTLFRYQALGLNIISGIKNLLVGMVDNSTYFMENGYWNDGIGPINIAMYQFKKTFKKLSDKDFDSVEAKLADLVERLGIIKDNTETMLERIDKKNKNFLMWFQQAGEYVNQSVIAYNELKKRKYFFVSYGLSKVVVPENMLVKAYNSKNKEITFNGHRFRVEEIEYDKNFSIKKAVVNIDNMKDSVTITENDSHDLFTILTNRDKFKQNIFDDSSEHMSEVITQIEATIAYYHGNYDEMDPIRKGGMLSKFFLVLKRWVPARIKLLYGPTTLTAKGYVERGAYNVDIFTAAMSSLMNTFMMFNIGAFSAASFIGSIVDIALLAYKLPMIPFAYALMGKRNRDVKYDLGMAARYLKAFGIDVVTRPLRLIKRDNGYSYSYKVLKQAIEDRYGDFNETDKQGILNAYAKNLRMNSNAAWIGLLAMIIAHLKLASEDCETQECQDGKEIFMHKVYNMFFYFASSILGEVNAFSNPVDFLNTVYPAMANSIKTVSPTDIELAARDVLKLNFIDAYKHITRQRGLRFGAISSLEKMLYFLSDKKSLNLYDPKYTQFYVNDFNTAENILDFETPADIVKSGLVEQEDKDVITLLEAYYNDNEMLRKYFVYSFIKKRFDASFDIKIKDDKVKDYLIDKLSEQGINILRTDNDKTIAKLIRRHISQIFLDQLNDNELTLKINSLIIQKYSRLEISRSKDIGEQLKRKIRDIKDEKVKEMVQNMLDDVSLKKPKYYIHNKIDFSRGDDIVNKLVETHKGRKRRGLKFDLSNKNDVDKLIDFINNTNDLNNRIIVKGEH